MFTFSVTQNKSLPRSLSCFVTTFSADHSASVCLILFLPVVCCGRVCLFSGLRVTCLGCWPIFRSCHSLKMTTCLLGEVDAARWPNMQGWASPSEGRDRVLLCYLPDLLLVVFSMWSCQQLIVWTGQTGHPGPVKSPPALHATST